ncbi:MAG TPA: hypothetical protein VM734_01450 [Kofleriaceae bacterium]|jgi:hypothetical protein|nr:hypothetical protein [Kofleriaceae bacterium]
MMRASLLFVALASLAVAGCKKKEEGSPASSGSTAASAKPGAELAKPASPTKLPKLDLQLDVPGEVLVSDGIGAEGHLVNGPSVGAISIEVAKEAQTLDQAKSDAEAFTPKNLKSETLADGWALTFENTGSMGTNYWVTVRREIGGKSIACTTTGGEAAQAAAVLAACKTLRP